MPIEGCGILSPVRLPGLPLWPTAHQGGASAVYVASMADRVHGHASSRIIDLVENPVVTDADPVRFDPVQFLAAPRTRHAGQTGQSLDNSVVENRRETLQIAFG